MPNIHDLISEVDSKSARINTARIIETDKSLFDDLNKLVLEDQGRISDRGAWVLRDVAETRQEWTMEWQLSWVEAMENNCSHPLKRNFLGIFQIIQINEIIEGRLLDLVDSYIFSLKEAPATRAFSITVLCRLVMPYKELREETSERIRILTESEMKSISSRASSSLKMLARGIYKAP